MKKIILLLFVFTAIGFGARAQQAADFTITDMHGNTHNLYQMLNDNKIVILDFWATWCGPCLASVPGLEEIWEDHGPEGDQTYVVISLEFDANTNDELTTIAQHGMTNIVAYGDPNGYRAIANTFNYGGSIPYFVVICPDKTWSDRTGGIGDNPSLLTNLGNGCNVTSSITVDGKLKRVDSPGEYLCPGEVVNPMVTIQNIGSTTLTTLDVETFMDNVSQGTYNWSGSLNKFAEATFPLNPITNVDFTNHDLRFVVSNPNGSQDQNNLNDEETVSIIPAPQTGDTVTLTITPDDYGSEIGWSLKNGMGQIIQSVSPGTYADNDNSPKVVQFILSPDECYTFEMTDSYGDGIFAPGGYTLTSRGATIISGGSYANSDLSKFHNKNLNTTAVEDVFAFGTMEVLPNPASSMATVNFNLSSGGEAIVNLLDISGKLVQAHDLGELNEGMHNQQLDLNDLAAGTYFVEIRSSGERIVKQLVVAK